MPPSGQRREAFKLSLRITNQVQEHLLRSPSVTLFVTNTRYPPLTADNVRSMRDTILSLYHNLLTGSGTFPVIASTGYIFRSRRVRPHLLENLWAENSEEPGSAVPPPPDTPHILVFTPVHPEQTLISVLSRDYRNVIHNVEYDGMAVCRVICCMYDPSGAVLYNRWRVTDYTRGGRTLMSVHCKFTYHSMMAAKSAGVSPVYGNARESIPTPTMKPLRV